ncbi:major capsid protein [Enterococcus sp. BWR-S5]|uniref:major capsid protein n=1 Tax=Enterococcus sp. BWR-S5 TaxID=2787714 RepID=UPI0019203F86|nr:major capsid protein [Enterococcus sp. BWR-S5]MBL1225373.1 major capsid protein [Enterococcus sp. BWR-S5]
MANIAELFSQKNVLDYVNNRQAPALLGETLFPARKVQGLEFDILKAGTRIPTIASVHAFDTEAEIASRVASRSAQELAFIKRKIQLKEKDLIALRNPRTAEEQRFLEQEVYNDVYTMVSSVNARVEKMRMEVLANGTVTLDENGLDDLVVDYGVPADHKATADFSSASTDIIGLLTDWASKLDTMPTRILTSAKVRNAILQNAGIKGYFKDAGLLPTAGTLNQVLQQFGLPPIATYDAKYYKENAQGKLVKERYFPENKLVMFGSENPGESIFGVTPEESRLVSGGSNDYKVGNVIAMVYESNLDPVGTWTKAAGTALPSFPEADNVFQATVLPEG